jgi:hypothetical protein
MDPMVSLDTSAAEQAVREALARAWPEMADEDAVHLDQVAIVAARAAAPAILDVAAVESRTIAERCEAKAKEPDQDRKHWLGLAAGLRMATVKLVALSDLAGRLARETAP